MKAHDTTTKKKQILLTLCVSAPRTQHDENMRRRWEWESVCEKCYKTCDKLQRHCFKHR